MTEPRPSIPAIGIDTSPLLVRSAGVKTYLHHWINALRVLHPDSIHTFLAPSTGPLDHSGGPLRHPFRLAALQALNYLPAGATDLFLRCDIFHASNLLRNIPRRPCLSTTLHDLTAWTVPEHHRPEQVAGDKAFADRVLKRADGIIAVSEHTREDAIRILGIHSGKIAVIHPGVAHPYFCVSDADIARALAAHKLRTPYFFNGTLEPRKNLDTLLSAWESLPVDFRHATQLIVAGMKGWNCAAILARLDALQKQRSGVRYLGYVPEADLPGMTAGALAMVYPSHYEGFGLPVAQAMAAGCPVITSNVSSLPEIAGEAALLIDPRSEAELAHAIRTVAESAALRERLRSLGRQRAARYTWEVAAQQSMAYFSRLL